ELEMQLVHDFAALAAVSAAYDQEMAGIVLRALSQEPAEGPFGDLLARLAALAPAAAPAVPAQRLPSGNTP
ncbi:TetR family transcriptional regulator, partial [Streptomyces sp. SID8455]|nr:TetR family transcriptional regulator [Streptomyces sp. SID8455]